MKGNVYTVDNDQRDMENTSVWTVESSRVWTAVTGVGTWKALTLSISVTGKLESPVRVAKKVHGIYVRSLERIEKYNGQKQHI